MYEYVCDRLIPGCDHRVRAETHEAMKEEAKKHLREEHDMEDLDKDILERLNHAAFWAIPMQ